MRIIRLNKAFIRRACLTDLYFIVIKCLPIFDLEYPLLPKTGYNETLQNTTNLFYLRNFKDKYIIYEIFSSNFLCCVHFVGGKWV